MSRTEKDKMSNFPDKKQQKNMTGSAGPTKRRDSSLPAALLVCAFLFVWQAAAMKMSAAYILPSPVRVVVRLWELRGPLFGAHLPATMQVVAIGLVISIFLGLGLAILMDFSPVARQALYPLIIASQTIPTTALAPLFVLWFGYSIWSRVLVTVLFTFFPVVVTVYDGFRSIPTEMKELMDTYGATPAQVFLKLKIPAVLPYFFSALKMAVPLSVIGAAIGEWLGAQSGLGYFSRRMMTQLDGAGVFAPILLLSIAAELLVVVVGLLEKHFLYWRSAE